MDVTAWLDSGDTSPLVQPPTGISLNPLPLSGLSSPVGAASVESLAAMPLLPMAAEIIPNPLLLSSPAVMSAAGGSVDPLTRLSSDTPVAAATHTHEGMAATDPPCPGLPDLVVTATYAPQTATYGEIIPVSWKVTNAGACPTTETWYNSFYLSTDTVFDATDTQIYHTGSDHFFWDFYYPYSGKLLPGQSATFSAFLGIPGYKYSAYWNQVSPRLPSLTVEKPYILFVTNSTSSQPETDQSNNVTATKALGLADLAYSREAPHHSASLGVG
jgi:hypothetical protein